MAETCITRKTASFNGYLGDAPVCINEFTEFVHVTFSDGASDVAQGIKKYRLAGTSSPVNRDDEGFYMPDGVRIALG